jgi:hypothetical protein
MPSPEVVSNRVELGEKRRKKNYRGNTTTADANLELIHVSLQGGACSDWNAFWTVRMFRFFLQTNIVPLDFDFHRLTIQI